MVIQHDFLVSAENVRWVGRDQLVEVVAGTRWRTPDHFYSNTLQIFLNGNLNEKLNDDGFTVIDDETFETKEQYLLPRNRVSCMYVKKEV